MRRRDIDGPARSRRLDRRCADRFPYPIPEVRGGGEGASSTPVVTPTRLRRDSRPYRDDRSAARGPIGPPGTTTNPAVTAAATIEHFSRRTRHGPAAVERLGAVARDSRGGRGSAHRCCPTTVIRTASGAPWTRATGSRSQAKGGAGKRSRGGREGRPLRRRRRASRGVVHTGGPPVGSSLPRGATAVWTLAPAARLDVWTGRTSPEDERTPRCRVVARGALGSTAAVGSARRLRRSSPTCSSGRASASDGTLTFALERVRWEVEAGARREIGRGIAVGAALPRRASQDMVVWAPDFRFI